jgi:hypothetical protein
MAIVESYQGAAVSSSHFERVALFAVAAVAGKIIDLSGL